VDVRLISQREESALVARAERAEAESERLRDANATLLDTLLHQKNPAPLTARKPDRVLEVIADVAGSNHALRKQLGSYARGQRADGVSEDDIVRGLLHWGDDDQGVAE
jgi:hypothetical protein